MIRRSAAESAAPSDPPPARPLLAAGLAALAGSAVGLAAPGGAPGLALAALLAGAAWAVGGAALEAWLRHGARARHWIAPWALVLAGAALCAGADRPGGVTGRVGGCATGCVTGGVTGGRACEAQPTLGTWRPWRSGAGRIAGGAALRLRIDGAPPPADGEAFAALGGGELVEWPRASVASPSFGPAPAAELRCLPDQIVRLAPAECDHGARDWLAPLAAARAELAQRARALERPAAPGAGLSDASGASGRGLPPGFVSELLFGADAGLDPELGDLFTRTGTRHLLAVSGQHLVVLAALLVGPLAALLELAARGVLGAAAARGLGTALRTLVVLAYIPIAAGAAPVTRSALALALTWCAERFPAGAPAGRLGVSRRADALSLWGLGLVAEVLLDPAAAAALSLCLSYAAVLGLALAYRPLRARIAELLGHREPAAYASAPWRAAAFVRGRAARWLAAGLAASCASVLATLPLSWIAFGEWCPLGILVTLAALPFFAWLLAVLWLAVLVPGTVPRAAYELPWEWLRELLELADRLPGTPAVLPPRPWWLVCAAGAGALALVARSGRARFIGHGLAARVAARATALAAAASVLPWRAAPRGLEIEALDVGHGTAIAVRAPGVPALVFDAGSRDRPQVARRALLPLLADWDAGSVAIVASHADRDHASALPWLAERLDVEFWAGAGPEECRARLPDTAWRADCAAGWIELAPPRAPPDLRLWLVRGAASADNEGSRSLVVEARGARFLLAGDAEDQGIAGFVAGSPGPPGHGPWRLITLPHHGSDGPRLGRLLTALAPAEVWVSCAGEPDAAAELERRGLAWRSTNAAGPLRLEHPRARAADSVYEPRASAADSVSNAVGED